MDLFIEDFANNNNYTDNKKHCFSYRTPRNQKKRSCSCEWRWHSHLLFVVVVVVAKMICFHCYRFNCADVESSLLFYGTILCYKFIWPNRMVFVCSRCVYYGEYYFRSGCILRIFYRRLNQHSVPRPKKYPIFFWLHSRRNMRIWRRNKKKSVIIHRKYVCNE